MSPHLPPNSNLTFVGMGGVNSITSRYAAVFIANLCAKLELSNAQLTFIDKDNWEPKNAERALFSRTGNKAAVAREELLPFFRESPLMFVAVPEFVTPDNIARLIPSGKDQFVLAAPDSHAVRKLLSDHCATLDDIVLIAGGNDGVEEYTDAQGHTRRRKGTFGNVLTHIRRDGKDITHAITRFHPEIQNPADKLPHEMSCTELAASSVPQLLFTNLQTASLMLQSLYQTLCNTPLTESVFDIAKSEMQPIDWPLP